LWFPLTIGAGLGTDTLPPPRRPTPLSPLYGKQTGP
jgi:hypothetical protein